MKTIFFISIVNILTLCQSMMIFDSGTQLILEFGTNVNVDSVVMNGTLAGNGTINGTPIPVELVSFSTKINGNSITLIWETATETNNAGFEIERANFKTIPHEWVNIGFVEGSGTTSEPQSYSLEDRNVSYGKYLYRLKQIDHDGSFAYSNQLEVEIELPTEFALLQNYPNPFNPITVINYQVPINCFVMLKIYDALGNEIVTLVHEEKTAGSFNVAFDGSKYTSGVYYYRFTAGNFFETKKFILLK